MGGKAARGGPDGKDPVPGDANYLNLMDTWMVYGPVDLSNTEAIQLDFFLKYEIVNGDHLYFGYSTDGTNYVMQERHGSEDWAWHYDLYDNLVGQNQVWFGWQFTSDSSSTWGGPWIDGIRLNIIPGDVFVDGYFWYVDRFNQNKGAEGLKVQLIEDDVMGSEIIAETTTGEFGHYAFSYIENWDSDPYDSDNRLDLYVKWLTENDTSQVMDLNSPANVYYWSSPNYNNVDPGLTSIHHLVTDETSLGAIWIFQDIFRTQNYYYNNTNPQEDVGYLLAKWEYGIPTYGICQGSCFWALGEPYVFIDHLTAFSEDMVVHELGHHVMYNETGLWLWDYPSCWEHFMFSVETPECAWYEGWADYFAVTVNYDSSVSIVPCYDFLTGQCAGAINIDYYDIEAHNRYDNSNKGDLVEGRIVGSLWDLMDNINEGFDSTVWDFDSLIDIGLVFPGVVTFNEFWLSYAGVDKHNGIRSLWQNSIEYNQAPTTYSIADQYIFINTIRNHLIDLYVYTEDLESLDTDLSYTLPYVSSPHCEVSLDNHWINLNPEAGWTGSCLVHYDVSDTLAVSSGNFTVYVIPVFAKYYLPIINKE